MASNTLLDVAIGYDLPLMGTVMLVAFVGVIALEGLIMYLLKYKPAKQSFADAFIVNMASSGVGLVLYMSGLTLVFSDWQFYLFFPLITIALEGLMMVVNRLDKYSSAGKAFGIAAVMNVASYTALYLFVYLSNWG